MPFTLAILYAGRWFGRAGAPFVENHEQHLIAPAVAAGARVSVFLVATHDSWCSAAADDDEATLAAEVASMFGKAVSHVALLPPAPHLDSRGSGLVKAAQLAAMAGGGKGGHASAFKVDQLVRYLRQFGPVANAEELRRRHGPHDVIIRARIDVLYGQRAEVAPLWHAVQSEPRAVFATRMYERDYSPEYTWPQWRDWNLVMGETCAAALVPACSMHNAAGEWEPLYNGSRRCWGYCIEEQMKLQLEHRGCVYRPLPWHLAQHRIYHRAPAETAEAWAARLAAAKEHVSAGVEWRARHGLLPNSTLTQWQCGLAGRGADDVPLLGSSLEAPPTWGGR